MFYRNCYNWLMNISPIFNSITFLSIPTFGLNWIDIFILIILLFYSLEGFATGLLIASIDLFSFASFLVAVTFYTGVASILVKFLPISHGFANAIGFFVAAAVLVEIIVNVILKILIANINCF